MFRTVFNITEACCSPHWDSIARPDGDKAKALRPGSSRLLPQVASTAPRSQITAEQLP